jgi:hypothetical protein
MMSSFKFPKIVNADSRKIDEESKARMKFDEALAKKKKKKKKDGDEFVKASPSIQILGTN